MRADERDVPSRSLGFALMCLLILAIAPAAFAHDQHASGEQAGVAAAVHEDEADAPAGAEITHGDTPAELVDGSIVRALAQAGADTPATLPGRWCGVERRDDDVANAAFPPASAQVKVVYAFAADQPDRFAAWADALQGNVSAIERFLAQQSGGRRAIRFDMGTSCGAGYVDIETVALPANRATYVDDFSDLRGAVRNAIGTTARRNVIILGDRLTDGGAWGIAELMPRADAPGPSNPHNSGGLTGALFVPAGTAPAATGWQPTLMLHEMSHNLGAVQWSAPHSTQPAGSIVNGPYGHCWDGNDVMCYRDGPSPSHEMTYPCPTIAGAISQVYDCGHDDYFDPAPAPGSYLDTHWNVYRSDFLADCAALGNACGGALTPHPPVADSAPVVAGTAQRGQPLSAAYGGWLNSPTSYAVRWQRSAGFAWVDVAMGAAYVPGIADIGTQLRVIVTATNADGAAVAASAPTAVVADVVATTNLRIVLRDAHGRRAGTLSARLRSDSRGAEVRSATTRVRVRSGHWRLRLCAGRPSRCRVGARVGARKGSVRLPSTKLALSRQAAPRVTATLVDGARRSGARGSIATR